MAIKMKINIFNLFLLGSTALIEKLRSEGRSKAASELKLNSLNVKALRFRDRSGMNHDVIEAYGSTASIANREMCGEPGAPVGVTSSTLDTNKKKKAARRSLERSDYLTNPRTDPKVPYGGSKVESGWKHISSALTSDTKLFLWLLVYCFRTGDPRKQSETQLFCNPVFQREQ